MPTRPGIHTTKSLSAMSMNMQKGAAMLIVLLITALASIVALAISERLALDLARTETLLQSVRGNELSAGLEALAGRLLQESQDQEPGYDHVGSLWGNALPGFPVPGGLVTGRMQSLDGRFNVNTLLTIEGQQDNEALLQCQRLLANLGLPISIADALVDWQDADGLPRSQGAEDAFYRQQSPAYIAANQALAHISELRLIAGINADVYQRLLPHVTVLPVTARRININLASVEVLQSLHESIDRSQAETLHQQGRARYQTVSNFVQQQAFPLLSQASQTVLESRIAVASHFFIVRADIMLANKQQRYFTLLERRNNSYDVHYRSFATL